MACNDVLASICGSDVRMFAQERRADCPGRLWNSGIIAPSSVLETLANGGTWATDYHFWSFTDELATKTGFPGTDDDCPPCETVGQKTQRGRKLFRTKCWENAYLNEQCNITNMTADQVIESLLGEWALDIGERDVFSIIRGLYLNNVADDASDLVYDASDAATNTLPGYMTKDAMLEGLRIMGCKRSEFAGTLVHEDVYTSLEKRDLITMTQVNCDDGACVDRAFFQGRQIVSIEDDALTVNGDGTGGFINVLFRPGAIAYGNGTPPNGNFQADMNPGADCGAGAVNYYQREQYSIHPIGWSNVFDSDAAGHNNMSFDDLADPSTWCRVHEKRNVGMTFVVSQEQ